MILLIPPNRSWRRINGYWIHQTHELLSSSQRLCLAILRFESTTVFFASLFVCLICPVNSNGSRKTPLLLWLAMNASENKPVSSAERNKFLQQAHALMDFIDEHAALPALEENESLHNWLLTQLMQRRIQFKPPKASYTGKATAATIPLPRSHYTSKAELWFTKAALVKEMLQQEKRLPVYGREKTLSVWLTAQKNAIRANISMPIEQKAVLDELVSIIESYGLDFFYPSTKDSGAGEENSSGNDETQTSSEDLNADEITFSLPNLQNRRLNVVWLRSYNSLTRFLKKNKRWPVKNAEDAEEKRLYGWCLSTRHRYNHFELSDVCLEYLAAIDFPFEK